MKKTYRSVKIREASYQKLELIRAMLERHNIYLNRSQTLQYSLNSLANSLEKIPVKKDEKS